ncbi:tryptophan synthase subunit beta [Citrobacter sp. JGM124]|uniref:tryptophan synthase subunit beta n=1 Tax=Citrobacter sp. JGM124 TaxID=2799789 RepID=UPI001BA5CE25|nr:tryptophan synthase subunit beta [Citrobacter sp. JGM124]MBS0850022.1 tryptophan synthase subunit beta [Citrobacter sp. JGM124]
MFFIQRGNDGRILRIEHTTYPEATEQITEATPEITEWLKASVLRASTLQLLQETDSDMVRVLEDLIGVLINRGIISITDLPQAAQSKLLNRAEARRALGGLERLIDEDDERLI